MLALIAPTALNVSTVVLKHNDPKLKPPKKESEAISSPNANQEEDTMIQEKILNDPAQGNYEVDTNGMQIEGGGEPSAFD